MNLFLPLVSKNTTDISSAGDYLFLILNNEIDNREATYIKHYYVCDKTSPKLISLHVKLFSFI